MDAVFHLDEASRADFLQLLLQSTGATYVCLWSILHQANCLIGIYGCYNPETTQPEALVHFLEYRQLIFSLENDHVLVPGFAFRNNRPYIELKESELQNRASRQTQQEFYRVAGIKTAIFMGCGSGEIEIGSSNVLNMEMEMRKFFPGDFTRSPVRNQLPQPTDPNRQSSSSSSLRSLSVSSSDSSMIFTIPSASHPQIPMTETIAPVFSSSINYENQQVLQVISQMRSNILLPSLESENDAMTRAFLAILTSPCPSSSSSSSTSHCHSQQNQNLPHNYQLNPKASAFKRYISALGVPTTPVRASLRPQSMLKRTILFYKKINSARPPNRPTSNQLHHMMSERKRRQMLNENFAALRSLLPSGTKKDKASVLTNARDYLTSLKAQIEELNRQNKLLESQLLPSKEASAGEEANVPSNERSNVRIIPVSESTSRQRIIELRVSVRGERPIVDILIQLLEFLKLDRNVSLMSIDAKTQITDSGSVNHINLRLGIEGNGWDESTFKEAVKRLMDDLTQYFKFGKVYVHSF